MSKMFSDILFSNKNRRNSYGMYCNIYFKKYKKFILKLTSETKLENTPSTLLLSKNQIYYNEAPPVSSYSTNRVRASFAILNNWWEHQSPPYQTVKTRTKQYRPFRIIYTHTYYNGLPKIHVRSIILRNFKKNFVYYCV